jgi:hypothetical protein
MEPSSETFVSPYGMLISRIDRAQYGHFEGEYLGVAEVARVVVGGAKNVKLLPDVWRVCQLIETKVQWMEREGTHQAIGRVLRPSIVDG